MHMQKKKKHGAQLQTNSASLEEGEKKEKSRHFKQNWLSLQTAELKENCIVALIKLREGCKQLFNKHRIPDLLPG